MVQRRHELNNMNHIMIHTKYIITIVLSWKLFLETMESYTEVFMLSAVMMLVAAILAALISCISNKESKALMSSSDEEQSTEELET